MQRTGRMFCAIAAFVFAESKFFELQRLTAGHRIERTPSAQAAASWGCFLGTHLR